jgi:hypothetical protein
MKKILITIILFAGLLNTSHSQVLNLKNAGEILPTDFTKFSSAKDRATNVPDLLGTVLYTTSLIINPEILYENKKVNFGLTKEISLIFPFMNTNVIRALSRIGTEYTYVFRDGRNHHLRGFFNLEIPIEAADYIAITCGIGGGYFTDFKKSGAFPQTSLDAIIPVSDGFALIPYIKLRHTFMFDRTQSDITDFSAGMGFTFMPFY